MEDVTGRRGRPRSYAGRLAGEGAAAAEVVHQEPVQLVLHAQAENFVGHTDLADTVAHLPGLPGGRRRRALRPRARRHEDMGRLVTAVDRPVNVLALPGAGPAVELAASAGVSGESVGGAFAFAALGAMVDAGADSAKAGTYGFGDRAAPAPTPPAIALAALVMGREHAGRACCGCCQVGQLLPECRWSGQMRAQAPMIVAGRGRMPVLPGGTSARSQPPLSRVPMSSLVGPHHAPATISRTASNPSGRRPRGEVPGCSVAFN